MMKDKPNQSEVWRLIPQGSVGVEIGVWRGDMSEKLLRNADSLHLVDSWSVESYCESDEFDDFDGYIKRYSGLVGSNDPADFQRYYDSVYESVVDRFNGEPVTIHRCSSDQFFRDFDGLVDWVYVDGAHSYDGCLADLWGAARIADCIYGDDYRSKPGVAAAVNEFIDKTGLELEWTDESMDGFKIGG